MSAINRRRIKRAINNRITQASFKDFFIISGFGVGIGVLMALGADIMAYTVSITICCSAGGTSFLIFVLPKLMAMMKSTPERDRSIGDVLAIGEDGDRPRVSSKNKIRPIRPEF